MTMAPAALEPRHHLGVLVGHAVAEHGARGRRQHARRVDVVLQRDGNAVQRPAPPPAGELRLERRRALHGALAGHGDESVEAIVLDPIEGRKRYEMTVSGDDDLRPQVFNLAKKQGWTLWELHEESSTLEDVFHYLTEEAEREAR